MKENPKKICIRCKNIFSYRPFKKRKRQDICGRCQIREIEKKYYEKHKEEIKERSKIRYTEIKKSPKEYEKMKKRSRIYAKKNHFTPKVKLNDYRYSAKKRNLDFSLTLEDIKKLWNSNCTYCGTKILTIGLDRINNTKGYSLKNITPCCKDCNFAKANKTPREFIKWIKRAFNHLNKKHE